MKKQLSTGYHGHDGDSASDARTTLEKCECIRFEGKSVLLKEQAAALLGIEISAIDDCLATRWPELRKLGYEVVRGERLTALRLKLLLYESERISLDSILKMPAISILEVPAFRRLAKLVGHLPNDATNGGPKVVLRRKPIIDKAPKASSSPNLGTRAIVSAVITRAISIRQPYVEQILRGTKTEEYRSLKTNIRERVYLYASLHSSENEADSWDELGLEPGSLPTGLIVGSVEIVDCHWSTEDGRFAYALERPERLEAFLRPINQPQPKFWIPQF
jgi:hypothetical protein